jgi:hypothetical protein
MNHAQQQSHRRQILSEILRQKDRRSSRARPCGPDQDVRRDHLGGEVYALAILGLIVGEGRRLQVRTGFVGARLGKTRVLVSAHVVTRASHKNHMDLDAMWWAHQDLNLEPTDYEFPTISVSC